MGSGQKEESWEGKVLSVRGKGAGKWPSGSCPAKLLPAYLLEGLLRGELEVEESVRVAQDSEHLFCQHKFTSSNTQYSGMCPPCRALALHA